MKNLLKLNLVIVFLLIFTACKNDNKQKEEMDGHSTEMKMESGTDMNSKTMEMASNQNSEISNQIIDSYIQLKNALVLDDTNKAAEAGKALLKSFDNFEMSKLTEAQHKEFMDIAETAKENAAHIVKSDIEHQREHFELLSSDINDLITVVGTNKTLYQDFCPMYNNKKGGIWLSETKEIKNPFFGSKMLKCGEIQKQIN